MAKPDLKNALRQPSPTMMPNAVPQTHELAIQIMMLDRVADNIAALKEAEKLIGSYATSMYGAGYDAAMANIKTEG